ncbi:hypothetical protein Tco_0412922 [Tanacetum coccineum]
METFNETDIQEYDSQAAANQFNQGQVYQPRLGSNHQFYQAYPYQTQLQQYARCYKDAILRNRCQGRNYVLNEKYANSSQGYTKPDDNLTVDAFLSSKIPMPLASIRIQDFSFQCRQRYSPKEELEGYNTESGVFAYKGPTLPTDYLLNIDENRVQTTDPNPKTVRNPYPDEAKDENTVKTLRTKENFNEYLSKIMTFHN